MQRCIHDDLGLESRVPSRPHGTCHVDAAWVPPKGKFYVLSRLPFGLSQAPYVFTRIMQCAHEWSRCQQHAFTAMIDDAAVVHGDHRSAAVQTCAVVWIEAVYKSHLWPSHWQQSLGFDVDWARGKLWVPQGKIARLQKAVARLQQGYDETVLKSVLGLLASCGHALRLTPLLGRWMRLGADNERCVGGSDSTALTFYCGQFDPFQW